MTNTTEPAAPELKQDLPCADLRAVKTTVQPTSPTREQIKEEIGHQIRASIALHRAYQDADNERSEAIQQQIEQATDQIQALIPARTVPTRQEIVDALFTQNIKNLSQNHNAKQNWRALADAVLTLLAWQPTIDEVWLAATAEERIRSDNGTRVPLEALLDVNEVEARALEEARDAYPVATRDMVSRGSVRQWLNDRAQQIRDGGEEK